MKDELPNHQNSFRGTCIDVQYNNYIIEQYFDQ